MIKPCLPIFQAAVKKHHADKYVKGFYCEHLLQAMLFAQLSNSQSYRVLEHKMNWHIQASRIKNMLLISRSTLSAALANRCIKPFEQTVSALLELCQKHLPKQECRQLKILDSTPFQLKGKGFDKWVQDNGRIQGMKMHTLIDSQNNCIETYQLTLANQNDITVGKQLVQIQENQTYVFDKGYCDYNWWWSIHQQKAFFVTRAKSNAAVNVIEQKALNPKEAHILADELVVFTNHHQKAKRKNHYTEALRRITVKRENDIPLILFSNDLTKSAAEIAEQYRSRWQIELWFKWIKQHLLIKHFLGKTENAVMLQILCALIAYLLLRLYQVKTGFVGTLHQFLAWLSSALLERATEIVWKVRWHKCRRNYFGQ